MTEKQALIEWVPREDGGRSKPPAGFASPAYSTVVRFIGGATRHSDEAWSLVVTKRRELGSRYRWLAEVHYLFPDAPHESLEEGRSFELLEGNKCVARGRILAPQDVSAVLTVGSTEQAQGSG